MLTRSSPTLKQTKFEQLEQEVLVVLNQRLKLTEVTDKKAEVLGAISRIGYSAEKMATFCNDLNAVISTESSKAGFSLKSLRRRSLSHKESVLTEDVLTKEIASELREQIIRVFPITAFTLRPPAPEDILDITLESYVTGACKNRFYQVDAVDGFLDEIRIIRKEVLRSLVTGLRGIGNLRNVKTKEIYSDDDPFKDLSVNNIIASIMTMIAMSPSVSASNITAEGLLNKLAKFEQVGIRAHALLSENRLCYGGIESNFRDWGALSAALTCPVQKITKQLETDLLIPEKKEQVTEFIGKLNQLIVEAIELSVEFEALRHAEEGVEIESASKALTKDLYRAPSAFYKESNIAAAEAFYNDYDAKKQIDTKSTEGATGGASDKGDSRFKLLRGLSSKFFKRRQQEVQFRSKEKHKVDVPAETGDLATRLPLGFVYQNGEYVFQGNAQSVEYLSELAELAVNQAEPVKTCMEWEFIAYSDGVYRMKGNPYYMFIEGHIYSADLACELVKKEDSSSNAEVEGASAINVIYENIEVAAGVEIQLTKDIKVTTPIKRVLDESEPAAKLIFQPEERSSKSK